MDWKSRLQQARSFGMSERSPSARWVAPTLFFFGALFIAIAIDELLTGAADTGGVKSVPRHIAHPDSEPFRFYFVVLWNLLFGVTLLAMGRQQWKLRRAMLARKEADEQKDQLRNDRP
jgi:hypothetical protein